MNNEEFMIRVQEKFGDRFEHSEYTGYYDPLTVKCKRHNNEYVTKPHCFIKSKVGCCNNCQFEKLFINKAREKFGDKYHYGIGFSSKTYIEIKCPFHGDLNMLPNGHLSGDGCGQCTAMNKYLKRVKEKHGDRFEYGVYFDATTPIEVICPDHGSQMMRPAWHHDSTTGCPECGAFLKTTEQYIEDVRKVHGDRYQYGEYTHSMAPIDVFCSIHGKFTPIASDHLRGSNCPECMCRKITKEVYIERCNAKYDNKYDYSKTFYNTISDKVTITCPDHGDFDTMANKHMTVSAGCRKCSNKELLTFERFVSKAREIHGDKYEYSEEGFNGHKGKATIICPKHGEFKQRVNTHTGKDGSGCPRCSKTVSKGELEYLASVGLPNDAQHRQVRIPYGDKRFGYYVDGFDPTTNTIYEYDGDFWHGNPAIYNQNEMNPKARKTYGELYDWTMTRKRNLTEAGYTVISIWESDWKNRE